MNYEDWKHLDATVLKAAREYHKTLERFLLISLLFPYRKDHEEPQESNCEPDLVVEVPTTRGEVG